MKLGFDGFPRRTPQEEKGGADSVEETESSGVSPSLIEHQYVADQLVERISQLPQSEPISENVEDDGFVPTPTKDMGDIVRTLREQKQ